MKLTKNAILIQALFFAVFMSLFSAAMRASYATKSFSDSFFSWQTVFSFLFLGVFYGGAMCFIKRKGIC